MTEKLWPPVSGYSIACWLHFPPQGEQLRKSHTVSLALCEGLLMQNNSSMYAVLVGPALTLYHSKEDAVSGCSDIATHEITDYRDMESLSFLISTALNDELVFRTESSSDFDMWRKTLLQVVVPRTYVNLISIYALEQPQCYTRIYFDANSNCLRVDTSSSAQSSTVARNMSALFKNVDISLFATNLPSWHHVILAHRKSVVGSSIITLYIDGAEVTSKKLHYPSAPVPCSMQCFLGQDPQFPSAIRPMCIGPLWLLSDVLPPLGATVMFLLGPDFTYQFTGNTSSFGSLNEWTEAAMTQLLHRLSKRRVDVVRAAKRLSLAKCIAASQTDWACSMSSILDDDDQAPRESLFRNFLVTHCQLHVLGAEVLSLISSFKWSEEHNLWATHTPTRENVQVLYVDTEIRSPLDFPRVLPSLGGLGAILYPWFDVITSSRELMLVLKIIVQCLKKTPELMADFLDRNGHAHIIAFICDHIDWVDASVLQALCKFAISGNLKLDTHYMQAALDSKLNKFSYPVIVDTHAMQHIVLNPIFRNALNLSLQNTLVTLISYTVHPTNPNALFNCRLLRQIHLLPWILEYICHLCHTYEIACDHDKEMLDMKQCGPRFIDRFANDNLEQLFCILSSFLSVEADIDDVQHISDCLLKTLGDESRWVCRCVLQYLLSDVESPSPLIARTLVDSVLHRLEIDRSARVKAPSWYGQDNPIAFSPTGFEVVLMEILLLTPSENVMSIDGLLALRILLSLSQVQPAFGAHLLVNSQLSVRLNQVLHRHKNCLGVAIPILAFVTLLPLHLVKYDAKNLATAFPEPSKYTPVAMDRVCIDTVWGIVGDLWKRNQSEDEIEETSLKSFEWLRNRLEKDALAFQAICRSSLWFLTMSSRCIVLRDLAPNDLKTISSRAAQCVISFLKKSFFERDDWADNMLYCLTLWYDIEDGAELWLNLLLQLLEEVLQPNVSVVAMKNLCSVFVGLLRIPTTELNYKSNKKSSIVLPQTFIFTVVQFITRTISHLSAAPSLGDESERYFYSILVFTVQCYLIHGICPTKEYRNDHIALLNFAILHKDLLLQQMNGSSILVYASTQGVADIYASGFRLNMRQLSLTSHHTQKELSIGTETDRIFILCFATGLLKLLTEYNESVAWVAVQLWKFLLTQRPMLMQELLIVEPKAKLLNSMSATKTSTIDMFHKGLDQLLVVNAVPSVEWQVFFTWLTANISALRDVLFSRTDSMFASISELLENVISIRKTSKAELTIHIPIVQAHVLYTTPSNGEIDHQLGVACSQLVAVERQTLYDIERAMEEAYRKWQQTQHDSQIYRLLWKTSHKVENTKSSASVYQASWMGEMALDCTEGPCRMRLRLKAWKNISTNVVHDTQPKSCVKGAIVDVFSILQQCLEFHDLVEVYRQCTSKYTSAIDRELLVNEITSQCKYPKTRERLQDIDISPFTIAQTIYEEFLKSDHFLSLGISATVVHDVAKVIESGNSGQWPSNLFDNCDSEAMQNSLLRKPSVSLVEDEDDKDKDEEEKEKEKGEVLLDVSDEEDEEQTPSSRLSILSAPDTSILLNEPPQGIVDQTTYGCILRYLHRNDLTPLHSYNVVYINGMQKAMGVFLFCQIAIYFIEGYTVIPVAEDDERKKRTHLQTIVDLTEVLKAKTSAFRVQPRSDYNKTSNITWRLKYDQIKQFYRIKYQLRPVGLEFVDVGGATFFCTYDSKSSREDVFKTLFTMPIRNSIYWAHVLRPGPLSSFKRLRQSFTKKWLRGEMSNFEYLIELNAMAGRSFNDLTQYPIFPWVLADYTSDTLDLKNPQTFRDLSKPMGALGSTRSLQFQERFQAMCSDGFDSPAFHYGTHYSCSAYVTYYLLRLEPYTSMAKELQGGYFDKADRLFRSIGASWLSASSENLQDVRELIPEFYYLPEFLVNANRYDLGTTQSGIVVDDVVLPPWARGDPREFIRLHRQALESKYVSENLHQWIDLIFGFKQRAEAAIEAQNVFMHLTYEGAIDIDAITDPVIREATLAQIENFGQTPSKLFNSPHPQRKVPSLHLQSHSTLMTHAHDLSLNAQSSIEAFVKWHAPLAPPLVSIGKEYVNLKKATSAHLLHNEVIGDIKLTGDKFVARGSRCTLVPPRFKKYIDWGTEGILVLRSLPKGKALFTIAGAQFSNIRCAAFSDDGSTLVSGGDDGVVSVFQCNKVNGQRIFTHKGKLAAHDASVLCVAIDKSFNLIVSGSKDLSAIVWDARTQLYVRELSGHSTPILHVGINGSNGNIMTAAASELCLWSINGDLLASALLPTFGLNPITCAISTRCDMWQNGVNIVTGHSNGTIACWGIQYPSDLYNEHSDLKKKELIDPVITPPCRLYLMKLLLEHRAAVTAVDADQRQLISADADGVCLKWQDDT
ncbi:hypothetical protein THRCLA_09381 [Thraustotheca clavata]|uniref:BEACH domain-containing protein n=1 Tax=Thraustotheca clavata TaxID=74557 RepID=A0A1V9YX62_9STRA|nr:hypothetical protein THRCLA_09381 [Thraustotheca clavata]